MTMRESVQSGYPCNWVMQANLAEPHIRVGNVEFTCAPESLRSGLVGQRALNNSPDASVTVRQ